ncbi:MAG: PEP-CTERM sorting domain-containing protein [Proteobacteria bacterium]|nr:MAG: PEP-CTERM sorting domain-containing protein [Pseudomonadota bacterium]
MEADRMKHLFSVAALTLASASALAAPALSVIGDYALNGGATTPLSVVSTPTGQEIFFSTESGPAAISARAWGDIGATTSFGMALGGSNHFAVSSLIAYSDVITNTSAVTQNYTFNFTIDQSAIAFNVPPGTSATGAASRDIQLNINGTRLSYDHIDIAISGSSATCTSESGGGPLGTYSNCASPNANFSTASAQNFAIALGTLLPGDSFVLDYVYLTSLRYTGSRTGGCALIDAPFGAVAGSCGGASAFIGDPFDTESTGMAFSVSATPAGNPASVPEPGTLALLAAAGAFLTSRRKAQAPAR